MNNFTEKQREIVARKLGYDGPMQGFDDFLNSSPALGMKYASITDKFATRMAKGGMARKKYAAGGSVEQPLYLSLTSQSTPAQVAAAYSQFAGGAGGDTAANQQAAVAHLQSIGISDATITKGYEQFLQPSATTTAAPVTTTAVPTGGATTSAPTTSVPKTPTAVTTAPKLTPEIAASLMQRSMVTGVPTTEFDKYGGMAVVQAMYDKNNGSYTTGDFDPKFLKSAAEQVAKTGVGNLSMLAATNTLLTPEGVEAMRRSGMDPKFLNEFINKYTIPENLAIENAKYLKEQEEIKKQQQQEKTQTKPSSQVTLANGKVVMMPANYDQNYVNQLVREAALAAGGTLSYADLTRAANTLGIPDSMIKGALSTGVVTGTPIDDAALKAAQAELARANAALAAAKSEAERQAALAAKAAAEAQVNNISTSGNISTPTTSGMLPTGAPSVPGATTITAAQTQMTPGMTTTPVVAGTTQQADVTQATAAAPIAAPTPITAQPITAASAAGGVGATLGSLTAQQGAVSDAAKATAATQAPETTAVAGVQAAQGVAGTVQGAPTRTAQEGEMVSGPSVDMARAEQVMAQTQAAQGVVTEDMTVQGQLNKLLTNFDAGSPPPWAAASMRAANAQMAARGLGASSMAGQAIIQATLEAATPIAAADAKVFETMGLQNLSNRQQVAMLVGQQRAAFLGQEFDQAFQTRVLNAARVADIANKNFDAQTQIAIENSRLANTMDVANLSARNAVVMGKMAQMSQLETINLSNRQQVAVENAKAFLTMDIKNLDNRQQTALFKAQEMNDALVSDAGFANAVNITNSQNALEAEKVSATLSQNAAQFNADMMTKVNMSNALAANELAKFNAQQANAREEFNSNMTTQINLANAKILAEISTANTAAVNAANAINAKNATDLSAAAYAQQSQTYRDLLEMSWKTGESEKDRATQIVAATLSSSASTNAAKTTADASALANIAKAGITLLANYDKVKVAGSDILSFFKD